MEPEVEMVVGRGVGTGDGGGDRASQGVECSMVARHTDVLGQCSGRPSWRGSAATMPSP